MLTAKQIWHSLIHDEDPDTRARISVYLFNDLSALESRSGKVFELSIFRSSTHKGVSQRYGVTALSGYLSLMDDISNAAGILTLAERKVVRRIQQRLVQYADG